MLTARSGLLALVAFPPCFFLTSSVGDRVRPIRLAAEATQSPAWSNFMSGVDGCLRELLARAGDLFFWEATVGDMKLGEEVFLLGNGRAGLFMMAKGKEVFDEGGGAALYGRSGWDMSTGEQPKLMLAFTVNAEIVVTG